MQAIVIAALIVAFSLQATSAQDALKPVKLLTVEAEDASVTRQFFGKVVARQTVDLAFQVGGQITQLPLVEGELVPGGNLIAQLDLEPFDLALEQARLQEDQADRAVERYQQLITGNTISQVTLDDAVTQAGVAAVAVRNAEYSLEQATLLAPYDALVAERLAENFATIAAGTPIARLHDMSEIRIEIDVPEVLFQRAGNDPDVTVTARFPASDEVFPLSIREFNAETSAVGQTFQITFGMAPPPDLRILPGSSVTVTTVLHEQGPAITLSATALLPTGDGGMAAMLFEPGDDGTGTVKRVAVDVEPLATGRMRVLDGLSPGMQIVAMGGAALEDGTRVRPFLGFGK